MALEIAGGAALGTIFAALYDVVKIAIGKTVIQYKPLLGDLKFTLDSLRPRIIQQIGEHNLALGLPNDEIDSLQQQMEEGVKLVAKLSKLGMWDCGILCSCCNCTKPSYADKLVELDRSLRILLEILKLQEARDVKEVLLLARKIHDKQDDLDKRLFDLVKVQQEAGLRAQQETNMREFSGSNNTQTMGHCQSEGNGVQGATLGATFGVLFGAVIQVKDKTRMFKRILGYLKSTIDSLKPLIEEITEYNKVLHLSKEELENFRIQMEKGAELVHKCSKVRKWASYKKYEYTNKLLRLDESLQVLLSMLRVQLVRDVRESLVSVSNTEAVIKRIEGSDVVRNDQIVRIGCCPVPEPPSAVVGWDVLNIQGTQDVILETFGSARKIEEEVKLVGGSGVAQLPNDQIEIKRSCEVVEPPPPAVALDVLNVRGTRNVKETLDSTTNIEAASKKIKGSGLVQNQIDVAVTEPPSPTVGLDAMNMQRTRDENESLVSLREEAYKQIKGIGVVEVQAADVQLDLLEDKNDPEAKRWKAENVSDQTSSTCGGRIVKVPRVLVHTISETNILDDGHAWWKYGQKELLGNPNPRCAVRGCPMKKQVEPTSHDSSDDVLVAHSSGSISAPNKPAFDSSSNNNMNMPVLDLPFQNIEQEVQAADVQLELLEDKNDPKAKRWKAENVRYQTSSTCGGRIVKEPRVVVHTINETNILDDGHTWRKYGQKELRGNPNPRRYYRCTVRGCPMKKQVEPTSHDSRVVTTTYRGTHNHGDDVLVGHSSGSISAPNKPAFDSSSNNNMNMPVLDLPFQNIEQPTTQTKGIGVVEVQAADVQLELLEDKNDPK